MENNQNQGQYEYQQAPYQSPQPQPPVEEKASVGLAILSFLFPIAGLIIFLVEKNKRPKTAKVSGICGLVSFLIALVFYVIMMVSGAALLGGALGGDALTDDSAYSQSDEGEVVEGNTLGDYDCVIKGAELTKDYEGKDAVVVTFDFTNNADEPMSFDIALDAQVYQDGIGLETAITNDDADYFDVEIKKGVTKEVKKVYLLRDTTTPLEVEVSELFSLDGKKIVKTLELN